MRNKYKCHLVQKEGHEGTQETTFPTRSCFQTRPLYHFSNTPFKRGEQDKYTIMESVTLPTEVDGATRCCLSAGVTFYSRKQCLFIGQRGISFRMLIFCKIGLHEAIGLQRQSLPLNFIYTFIIKFLLKNLELSIHILRLALTDLIHRFNTEFTTQCKQNAVYNIYTQKTHY